MLVKVAAKRNVLSPFSPIYILTLSRPRIVHFFLRPLQGGCHCRLVTSINTRFSTRIYQTNGKNASLVGFKLVQTGLFFLRQFWPLDSKKWRSFKRWYWKSKYNNWQDEEVEPRAVLLRERLTSRFCLRRIGMRSYNSIFLCGLSCYVKDVSRVLLAHWKCGRKKDIACKLRPLHVAFESIGDETNTPGRNSFQRSYWRLVRPRI